MTPRDISVVVAGVGRGSGLASAFTGQCVVAAGRGGSGRSAGASQPLRGAISTGQFVRGRLQRPLGLEASRLAPAEPAETGGVNVLHNYLTRISKVEGKREALKVLQAEKGPQFGVLQDRIRPIACR